MPTPFRLFLGLFAFLLLTAGANAQPITWFLQAVSFDDGGTASGSFNYDAGTNTYSDIKITTTTGVSRNGARYGFLASGFPADQTAALFTTTAPNNNQTGLPGLALFFQPLSGSALDGFGGTLDLSITGGQEADCGDATCSAPVGAVRFAVTGTIGSSETLEQYMLFGG